MTMISSDEHRQFFQRFPSGVCIVAAVTGAGEVKAMTCSSLTSVSTDPPMLVVSLQRHSATTHAITETAAFAVYLLAQSAVHVSDLFARTSGPKREEVGAQGGCAEASTVASLDLFSGGHAYAAAHCGVVRSIDVATQRLFVGRIKGAMISDDLRPLLRHKSWCTTIQEP